MLVKDRLTDRRKDSTITVCLDSSALGIIILLSVFQNFNENVLFRFFRINLYILH